MKEHQCSSTTTSTWATIPTSTMRHVRGWGTVCSNQWGTLNAIVVCRQMGFQSDSAQATTNPHLPSPEPHFGKGSGPVWLVYAQRRECEGTYRRPQLRHDCSLDETKYLGVFWIIV